MAKQKEHFNTGVDITGITLATSSNDVVRTSNKSFVDFNIDLIDINIDQTDKVVIAKNSKGDLYVTKNKNVDSNVLDSFKCYMMPYFTISPSNIKDIEDNTEIKVVYNNSGTMLTF